MEILKTKRGYSKTYHAIRKANETSAYIIVLNMDEANRVAQEAEKMGMSIRYPITFSEFMRTGMAGSRVKNVIIDNVDHFLRHLFAGIKIEMITMTE